MDSLSGKFIGAVQDEWQMFSDCPQDYSVGAPIGFGASSIVYDAVYHPPPPQRPIQCALKVLDLDILPPRSLSLLQRETQLMSLSKHPNVLRVRGSWIDGHKLYIALRLMNKGSAADIMHYGWPGGMEEEVVKCILKQALEGINYLHVNGSIHRDIKAANLLIDDDGTVLLGDLGVAASLTEDTDTSCRPTLNYEGGSTNSDGVQAPLGSVIGCTRPQVGKRKSFVGTPCWMAPELIEGKRYGVKADIWSFGVTCVELTQGRPPRARESPHSVLLQIVQGKPPSVDREGGVHRYSQAFKDIADACLTKDPAKRPTAAQLLQTPFFRSAKKKSYLTGTILAGLPPLVVRQERRKLPPSLTSQGTMDSWDFSLSAIGSISPSINAAINSRAPQGARNLSSSPNLRGSFELDSFQHSVLSRKDPYPQINVATPEDRLEEYFPDPHVTTATDITPGTSHPLRETVDVEDEGKQDILGSSLPLLSSSPSTSSKSLQSQTSQLQELEQQPIIPLEDQRVSTFAPVPIRRRLRSMSISLISSSPHTEMPSTALPASVPSVWGRITRSVSRNALMGDELPTNDSKTGAIARFFGRRRSSFSLSQRPNLPS
ncbi:kinase-like protein [Pisolithus marmoratus]|nr:kinase-like protein [Pisolithus marmoratus]